MSSIIDQALLELYLPVIDGYMKTRYSEVASSAIIVFDHLITIDEEIEYVWRKPWSLGKCLFIMNRYYTLAVVCFNTYSLFSGNLTDTVRLHFFRWQGWTGLVTCMLAEIILQLRLYALYSRSKWIFALLFVAFGFTVAASGTIMGTTLNRIQTYSNLIPDFPACIPLGVSGHFYAFWIPILCFETLLCSLAILRGYISYKRKELDKLSGRHILEILIRDSILYFMVMFGTYFTVTMIWAFAPETYLEIPVGFSVAMSCVMGNRLLLNIRSGFKSALLNHYTGNHSQLESGSQFGPLGSQTQASNVVASGWTFGPGESFFSFDDDVVRNEYFFEERQGAQRKKLKSEVMRMQALRNLRAERTPH